MDLVYEISTPQCDPHSFNENCRRQSYELGHFHCAHLYLILYLSLPIIRALLFFDSGLSGYESIMTNLIKFLTMTSEMSLQACLNFINLNNFRLKMNKKI